MAAVLQEIDEAELINVALVRNSKGACLRGKLKTSGRAVALKLLSTDRCLLQMQAVLAQGGVCTERVLQPVGVYQSRFLTALLWDWMPEGSLHSLLYETLLYPDLPQTLRLRILLEVADGLNVLHAISQPHGALKTTNVLLDQQYHAKLCDWGRETLPDMRTQVCTSSALRFRDAAYLAPEVLLGKVSCAQSDIYSFGVLMWETLNRRPPDKDFNQLQNLLTCTQKGAEPSTERILLPPEMPHGPALARLISRCLSAEPKQRPLARECVLELRNILESLDSGTDCRMVQLIRTHKERALLSCKHTLLWELPVEINNLEGYGGCTCPKDLKCKSVPVPVCSSQTPDTLTSKSDEASSRGSPPSAITTQTLPSLCCRDVSNHTARHYHGVCARASMSVNMPWGSPTSTTHTPLRPANQVAYPVSSKRTCCRLLQERREVIVRFMTEGRLNNVLDVLRARGAVTREHYEFITAAATLSARTRCLLDTCSCLGENVAVLVATTLGLVSMETAQQHIRSPEGQAG